MPDKTSPPKKTSATGEAAVLADLKTRGCTNVRLRQLVRRVDQHYDLEMAKAGLKTTQYSLLTYVLRFGPLRPGELAQGLKLTASTLSRNLKPLVDAGWLELSAGTDARSRLVSLTDAGRAKREEARHHWRAAQDGLNVQLGAARVLALHNMIEEAMGILSPEELPAGDI